MWYLFICRCDNAWLRSELTNSRFFLLECDICVIKLMDDFGVMDEEFSTLKNQLESFSQNVTSHTKLEKLEDAIADTKVPTTISHNSILEGHWNANVLPLIIFPFLGFGPQVHWICLGIATRDFGVWIWSRKCQRWPHCSQWQGTVTLFMVVYLYVIHKMKLHIQCGCELT